MYKNVEKALIAKLFSGNLKKDIIQSRKFGENSSKSNILTLKVVQKPNQIVLCACTAKSENLIFVMDIEYMRKISNILQMIFFQKNCLYSNGFACFYHFLKFFCCSGSNHPPVVHDGYSSTDLFDFFHVVRSVNDCGTLTVKFLNTFKDFVTALWIDCDSRLIQNDEAWLMSNSTGNIQPS